MIRCATWCGILAAFCQLARVQAKAAFSISLQVEIVSLIGWTSDTRSQEYTNLQSLGVEIVCLMAPLRDSADHEEAVPVREGSTCY